jgi:hypothetical protein
MKGTWELEMISCLVLINYAIFDEENDRVLFLEGFCYSPTKEKRDLMHQLESIIKSVSLKKL